MGYIKRKAFVNKFPTKICISLQTKNRDFFNINVALADNNNV